VGSLGAAWLLGRWLPALDLGVTTVFSGTELVLGAFAGGLLLSFLAGFVHEFIVPRFMSGRTGTRSSR